MERFKRLVRSLNLDRGVPPSPSPRPPPQWELAAKQELPATSLVRDQHDHVGAFFLALALAFNDLKGLIMFELYLNSMGKPDTGDYSPHAGQWGGVMV